MEGTPTEQIEINTPKSWEISRAYAQKLGAMPQSFTSIIRMLLVDHEKNNGEVSNANVTQAGLLLNSESLKAMYYYSLKTFRAERLASEGHLTKRKLTSFFTAHELACIMAMSLLYRRCKKLVPAEKFSEIASNTQIRINAGGYVGQTIPHIGLGWGMLAGAVRLLGEVAFMLHDSAGYEKYLTHKSNKDLDFDVDFETSRWGCTSIQIACNLLQELGFGISTGECLIGGLDPRTPEELIQEDKVYRVKVTGVWIEALLSTGDIPQITHRGAYYPMEKDLQKLKIDIQKEPRPGSDENWLDKNKNDISEETTPQLFRGASPAAPSSSDAESQEEEAAIAEEFEEACEE